MIPIPTITFGNRVIPKNVAIFNLPTRITCPNCDKCSDTCYARKAERVYPSVLPARHKNLELSKNPMFADQMKSLVNAYGITMMRIHEAGDFYDQEYADKWDYVIKKNPSTLFYAYTKSPFHPQLRKNFNAVESLLPDGCLNYGLPDYIRRKAKEFRAYICPYHKSVKQCGITCLACMTNKHVLFLKH